MPIRHHTSIPSLIIAPHTATYSEVIKAKAGEILSVGEEDIEFPGWLWCTDGHGISSWVPKEFLKPTLANADAELLFNYDASELTVQVGETVIVYSEQSGWLWCQNVSGEWGWIPKSCVAM